MPSTSSHQRPETLDDLQKKIVIVEDRDDHGYLGYVTPKKYQHSLVRTFRQDMKKPLGILPYLTSYGTVAKLAGAALENLRDIDFSVLDKTDVQRLGLQFPYGTPETDTLYVMHPVRKGYYLPAAQFHQKVFDSKFREMITMLAFLGAKHITVEYDAGTALTAAGSGSVENYGTDVKVTTRSDRHIHLATSLTHARRPSLHPESMRYWYLFEETWQTVADLRLQHGADRFSLSLLYENDFGVDVKLKFVAKGAPLSFGGEMKKFERTQWRVCGDFE